MSDAFQGSSSNVHLWDRISFRITAGVLLMFTLAVATVGIFVNRQETGIFNDEHLRSARDIGSAVADEVSDRMMAGGGAEVWASVTEAASLVAKTSAGGRIMFATGSGDVKVSTDKAFLNQKIAFDNPNECPKCESTRPEDFPATTVMEDGKGGKWLRVASPLAIRNECSGCHQTPPKGVVLIDFDLTRNLMASEQRKSGIFLIGGLCLLVVSAFTIYFVNRTVNRRLGCEPQLAAGYARRIAAGDLDFEMDLGGKTQDSMIVAFDQMARAIRALVADAIQLSQAAVALKFDVRADPSRHQGDFRKIVLGVNATLDTFLEPVQALLRDTAMLNQAVSEGRLDVRADATHHRGEFRNVVEGINQTLDAIVGPLNVTSDYLARLARGEIPPHITADYRGEFETIRQNINQCLDAIDGVIVAMNQMSRAHDAGDIDESIDASRFQGAYRDMARGVNEMVGAHIAAEKTAMACVDEFGKGNFDAPLTRFPGKKAFVNDIIEQVRGNLKAVIADIDRLAQAAVDGDVSVRADAERHQGDFRKIVAGVNATLETIVQPIIAVKRAADAISSASREIAAGNADLSQRTEQAAANLDETATSMEELASTVRQNAENARQASDMAVNASVVAARGGDVVERVVGTMTSINESSRRVVDIISVIDGIAFQTNILALNAAVEAARAGEQGRGFAVVAGEVRSLAQRSAAAAKEIKELITDSVDKVDSGARQVEEAGDTMREVVDAVQRVTAIMQEIAAASAEQRGGIDNVNHAITRMDDVTQQNAALVEQTAAAAESLEEQTQNLVTALARFKIDGVVHAKASRQTKAVARPTQRAVGAEDEWTQF